MLERLGNVLYWTGCVVAAAFVLLSVIVASDTIKVFDVELPDGSIHRIEAASMYAARDAANELAKSVAGESISTKLDLLLEAEKRGILPDDKKALLDEVRRRGMMPLPPGYVLAERPGVSVKAAIEGHGSVTGTVRRTFLGFRHNVGSWLLAGIALFVFLSGRAARYVLAGR